MRIINWDLSYDGAITLSHLPLITVLIDDLGRDKFHQIFNDRYHSLNSLIERKYLYPPRRQDVVQRNYGTHLL